MVSFFTTYGKVFLSEEYFSQLVSIAARDSFGVAGMASKDATDSLKSLIIPDSPDKGVRVAEDDGKLVIDLHIKVTYGLNIAAAAKSITHKVKYVVEEATGLSVKKINVSVDDVVS